ncbi:MAG: acyl-CoA dehydrogenase family protein [Desulfobacteraceae bacterium]|nr:acyl-CoA dehydrogenase family protein [Desulfobacteraceae bacterium]
MPTIDNFIRPREWVSDFTTELGKVIRRWGEEKYIPIRQQVDEDWSEHKLIKPLLKEVLVDLGINAAFFPAEAGGTDMPEPMALSNVICEELARIDSGFAVACICSVWGFMPILLKPHRNMELCMEFGPKFCGEELYVGCHAMTEPASGSDVENFGRMQGKTIQTTATLDDDEWIINGHKIWPTNSGEVGDLYTVVCTTNRGSTDPNDFALILVPADAEGVSVGRPYQKAGMSADVNTDVWFDHVRVPKRYRLHGPGDDLKYWKRAITMGNVASSAMCVGIMKAVYEIIKKWTTERVIAGKPLKEHSIVADMLSEIAMLIESTSAWMWSYTREIDNPDIYGWDPWDERFVLKTRGLALFATNAAERATSRAMDFMGSYGYAREFDIEKHWRDQKVIGLWMGGKGLKTLENARYWFDLETL